MKAVLFNVHDVALLLTIGACALLSAMRLGVSRDASAAGFALFLGANALVAFNTLIFWAEPVRYPLFNLFPYLYLFLGAVGFMLGPLLYWQLRAHLRPGLGPEYGRCLHFLPAILALAYLYVVCFSFPHEVRQALFLNLQIYQQPYAFFEHFISLEKLIPIVYAILCIRIIQRHASADHVGAQALQDLLFLARGFLVVWLWEAFTHFFGTVYSGNASDFMGILGNYFKLGLVLLLIYREQGRAPQARWFLPVEQGEETPINEQHVDSVKRAMTHDKVYLNPQLTLERFADTVQCSPREVSLITNRHFHQNFHEFVSTYRVEEVKRCLRDPSYNSKAIFDIAQAAGFNSKATFHRFFKRAEAITPSQYRKQSQGGVSQLGTRSQRA